MKYSFIKYHFFFILLPIFAVAQTQTEVFLTPSDTLNNTRKNAVVIGETAIACVALVGLNQLWYADYDRSQFHILNDNSQWLQMDKMGHVFTSYQLGKHGAQLLNWSGVNKNKQLLYGATLGFTFLSAVEILDGFSKEWGFSWGDILANATGTGLFVAQDFIWNEQRIALKFSFHQTHYASLRPDTLGKGMLQEVLKDYNGQTYWLSLNLDAFFKEKNIPKWLNIAVGYGAEGMLSGAKDIDNQLLTNIDRHRQFYLSLDVNLAKIRTGSKMLATIFDIFNMIKIPLPTVEFNKKGCYFHLFYY